MDTRYFPYLAAAKDFYDLPQLSEDELQVPVPDKVTVKAAGLWRSYWTGRPLPQSGWKVHVACRPEEAQETITKTISASLAHRIVCKHLRTVDLVVRTQAKYAEIAQSGKVITLYPRDEAELAALVAELSTLLSGTPGAHPPGDVPIHGTPISLRYGAFEEAWVTDGAGALRPGLHTGGKLVIDERKTPSNDPHSSPTAAHAIQERERLNNEARLQLSDVSLVHRSNAGGVYRGSWGEDKQRVIVKEARHHTGFDTAWTDASTRLRHEAKALQRLQGTGVAPEFIDLITVSNSDFLIMTEVPGHSMAGYMARNHPGAVAGADPHSYLQWVESRTAKLRSILEILHQHKVCHGDLHAANVIDDGERLTLIDFESAAVDGHVVATGVASPLSYVEEPDPYKADQAALQNLQASLINPLLSLAVRRPDLRDEILNAGLKDLTDYAALTKQHDTELEVFREAITRGIQRSATPQRPDRLFPGDIATFSQPRGGIGLLHGALGILNVLVAEGTQLEPRWKDWVVTNIRRPYPWTAGMDNGLEGVALAASRIGLEEEANQLLHQTPSSPAPQPWWSNGTAGQMLALAEASIQLADPNLIERALTYTEHITEALHADAVPGYSSGLLRGWSGVALALLRTAELLDAHGEQQTARELRTAAHEAITRELQAGHWTQEALLLRNGRKLMPYLANGSAALGLAAQALTPFATADAQPELQRIRTAVATTLGLPLVSGGGLLHGRAGLALTLRRLQGDTPGWKKHLHRLPWYAINTRPDDSGHRVLLILGEQNLRCSTDLGTGAAGHLLALQDLHPQATKRAAFETLLGLPTFTLPAPVSNQM